MSCNSRCVSRCRNYLKAHPALTWGERKEHNFFRFRGDHAGEMAASVGEAWLGKVPPGFNLARFYDGSYHLVNVTWSTGAAGDGVAPGPGAPWIAQSQSGGGTTSRSWRDYALEFPMAPGVAMAFDFDPVYLAHGMFGRASLASSVRLYGEAGCPPPKLLAVFRDPARQHCARAKVTGETSDPASATLRACVAALATRDGQAAEAACPAAGAASGKKAPFVAHLHNFCYVEHVVEWRRAVGAARVHLVKSEELWDSATRAATVAAVVRWAGLDAASLPAAALDEVHNSHPKADTDAFAACYAAHREPGTYLSDCNRDLAALLGDARWLWWRAAAAPDEL